VSAFDVTLRNRAVVAASPTAASANAVAATVEAQRPTADASTGGGPAHAGPSGAPSVAATGAARAAASIDTGPRGSLTAAVTAPPSAIVAPVSGPTTVAESGPILGVGRWLSAEGSWPTIETNASRRPADAAHLAVGPSAVRGATERVARHAVLPAADEASRRADGGVAGRVANPLATSPEEPAAVGARAADAVATAVEATGPQRLIFGPDLRMDGGLRRAGRSAPSEGVSGTGSHPPAAAAGPGIWDWPSDMPAAPNSQSAARPRSRARAPPAVIRSVRDGAAAHLQDASVIVLQEWNAVEPSTIAYCWLKSTILPNAVAMDVTAWDSEYRASSRSLGSDVNSVVSLMSDFRFGEQAFVDTPRPAREMALESWLTGGEDEGVRAVSADRIVFEQRERGDSADGKGRDESSDSDSECLPPLRLSFLSVECRNSRASGPEYFLPLLPLLYRICGQGVQGTKDEGEMDERAGRRISVSKSNGDSWSSCVACGSADRVDAVARENT